MNEKPFYFTLPLSMGGGNALREHASSVTFTDCRKIEEYAKENGHTDIGREDVEAILGEIA